MTDQKAGNQGEAAAAEIPQEKAPKGGGQKPSVGRVVMFHRGVEADPKNQPYPAVITHVWGDACVNLCVFPDGSYPLPSESRYPTSVLLLAPGATGRGWSWPPRV